MKKLLAAVLLAAATVSPVLACLKAPDSPSVCAAAPAPQAAPATRSAPSAPKPKPAPTNATPARTAPAHLLM